MMGKMISITTEHFLGEEKKHAELGYVKEHFKELKVTRKEFLENKDHKEIFMEACARNNVLITNWIWEEFKLFSRDAAKFIEEVLGNLCANKNMEMLKWLNDKTESAMKKRGDTITYDSTGRPILNGIPATDEQMKKINDLKKSLGCK